MLPDSTARKLDPDAESRVLDGVREAERYHAGEGRVHGALADLVARLDDLDVEYALIGAVALQEYGHNRVTVDLDVVVTREGLERFKKRWLGRGYVEKFEGSRGVRDSKHGVPIDFILAGDYPGDGKPKAVRFPDPGEARVGSRGVRLFPIETFVSLKLASGMTAAHRMRDLTDVLDLIVARDLPQAFAGRLDPTVRSTFLELWDAAQGAKDDPIANG